MYSKEEAITKISNLVDKFSYQIEAYKQSGYNETHTRKDFIDPFFEALGWDMNNNSGAWEAYREVIHEDRLKVGSVTTAPDYSFRLTGGQRLFFVEAKKPSVVVKDDVAPAYQVRLYGWNAKLAISIVTDFEEFAVYDCSKKPSRTDKASKARINYFTYKDYLNDFDFFWNTFSKQQVIKGGLIKFQQSDKKGTTTVDKDFLENLDKWRKELAANIYKNNEAITEDDLNFAVQQTIDRIIFLRIAEDRGLEPANQLKSCLQNQEQYKELYRQFRIADDKYNSGLFHFKKEKDNLKEPDNISGKLAIENKVIKSVISSLYPPDSDYLFNVLPVEILGSAYEQFLGKQIIVKGNKATIEEKPEVRKAGGVYYTPQYIVAYIVENTVGRLCDNKTAAEVSKLKIVDPACGSGSFLLGAYQYLLNWHVKFYTDNQPAGRQKNAVLTPTGSLTTAEKKCILTNNIYGVDIDRNAVEVTKLSLLLKCMEGETTASINTQMTLFHERVLPSLENNIKSGNSLIDIDFYDIEFDFGEEKKIKPFNWQHNFPTVFKQGGFDCVIGNPPYIPIETFSDIESKYYKKHFPEFSRKYDSSVLFISKGLSLLNKSGQLGFISTQTWQTGENYNNFRKKIFQNYGISQIINLPYNIFKDAYIDTGIFIFSSSKQSFYKFYSFNKKTKIESIKELPFETINTSELNVADYKLILNKTVNQILKRITQSQCLPLGEISLSTQGLSASRFQKAKPLNELVFPFINATVKRYLFNEDETYFVDLKNMKALSVFYKEQKKILIRRIINRQDRIDATYFNKKAVFKKDLNPFIITDNKFDTKYVLGLLNSKLFSWLYLNSSSIATKDDFRQTTLAELRKLPIKQNDKENELISKQMIKLVDIMLLLNQQLQQTTFPQQQEQLKQRIAFTDKKIDALVYELYRLSEDEIKIVEGA